MPSLRFVFIRFFSAEFPCNIHHSKEKLRVFQCSKHFMQIFQIMCMSGGTGREQKSTCGRDSWGVGALVLWAHQGNLDTHHQGNLDTHHQGNLDTHQQGNLDIKGLRWISAWDFFLDCWFTPQKIKHGTWEYTSFQRKNNLPFPKHYFRVLY